ncbi:MAG: radical SAM protein [Verrucomicrobia bacterium]|jgi:radical SAM protein with 4Fe4S-binding SPASM domain|nr:radical SAM protein [Verrucomicrobiota bacterium]OQC65836.1 MAG: pyrroloquinoline quinone biosynthesis protein PqqE [Verrucomicrobia bacterium ADurb.Bin006]HOA60319.1 radical SAM protein [Verrucomicrobiota bacterium]HOR71178.1 radical SAM protein [Verrucomicrobiota bacterium]HPK97684.1 radical SAM protein [Verrucomicrobiota bacterium]
MTMTDKFFLCYFETTRDCNLACKYCMSRPETPVSAPELSTEEARTLVLDELAKVSSNMAVAFSGGECLLRDDIYTLLAHTASRGMYSFVNTNGKMLVQTDAVRRCRDATGGRVIFVLPFNSIDAESNRSSRDDDTSTVMQATEVCRREGTDYFFLLTISKENLDTLAPTVQFLKMNRVPMLRAPFVPRGSGMGYVDLFFDADDMKRVIHPALTSSPLSAISYTPFFADPDALEATWKTYGVKIEGLGCQAGRSFAAVGAEGNVAPCVQLLDSTAVVGNVRQTPLSELIARHPTFQALRQRRENLKGRCGICRYRESCGGCRALAHYRSGDLFAEDPTCFFEPKDRQSRCDLEAMQTVQVEKFVEYLKYNKPWNVLF